MRVTKLWLCMVAGLLLAGCGGPAATVAATETVPPEPTLTATMGSSETPLPPTATRPPKPTNTPLLSPTPVDCSQGWTRLKTGKPAQVAGLASDPPIRVRSEPATGENVLTQIYPGTVVQVGEGPVCAEGLVFWKVENAAIPGGTGWAAEGDGMEYWLEPRTAATAGTVTLSALGVSFKVPGGWSGAPEAKQVRAGGLSTDCRWPDHIKITLTSYPARSEWKPTLLVYKTALAPDWFPYCDWVPELRVHQESLANGQRYVLGSTNARPLFNSDLPYRYTGSTPDGVYSVLGFFPVNFPLLAYSNEDSALPEGGIPFEMYSEDWGPYYEKVRAQLEAAGNWSFTPNLDVLDGIMESVEVESP